MFHGVHPMAGWPVGRFRRSRSLLSPPLYGLNQQLVLSPPVHRRATGTDLCKNLRMSPWGATTRLINRNRDTVPVSTISYYRPATDWKTGRI